MLFDICKPPWRDNQWNKCKCIVLIVTTLYHIFPCNGMGKVFTKRIEAMDGRQSLHVLNKCIQEFSISANTIIFFDWHIFLQKQTFLCIRHNFKNKYFTNETFAQTNKNDVGKFYSMEKPWVPEFGFLWLLESIITKLEAITSHSNLYCKHIYLQDMKCLQENYKDNLRRWVKVMHKITLTFCWWRI